LFISKICKLLINLQKNRHVCFSLIYPVFHISFDITRLHMFPAYLCTIFERLFGYRRGLSPSSSQNANFKMQIADFANLKKCFLALALCILQSD